MLIKSNVSVAVVVGFLTASLSLLLLIHPLGVHVSLKCFGCTFLNQFYACIVPFQLLFNTVEYVVDVQITVTTLCKIVSVVN